ncbi:hypothetical protein [Streptosporangium sp. NPDC087985]|uniref:hypothetical protein n=1 Tax=Streptosporangium sp. NPDC087985 TaxID=3366196 RepID=UPI003825EF69
MPTYTIDPQQVVAHHAGGIAAFEQAIENVEDDEAMGAAEALGRPPAAPRRSAPKRSPRQRGT